MSIQEHLNKIRNAIYGREVRESIAKGIETAYDDASENGNANMEVKIARGTHPNLKARLDKENQEVTAQLAQKVDEVVFNTNRQSIDFLAEDRLISTIDIAEAGNSQFIQDYIDTLVSNGQIEGISLARSSVTVDKLYKIEREGNLYDFDTDYFPDTYIDTLGLTKPAQGWGLGIAPINGSGTYSVWIENGNGYGDNIGSVGLYNNDSLVDYIYYRSHQLGEGTADIGGQYRGSNYLTFTVPDGVNNIRVTNKRAGEFDDSQGMVVVEGDEINDTILSSEGITKLFGVPLIDEVARAKINDVEITRGNLYDFETDYFPNTYVDIAGLTKPAQGWGLGIAPINGSGTYSVWIENGNGYGDNIGSVGLYNNDSLVDYIYYRSHQLGEGTADIGGQYKGSNYLTFTVPEGVDNIRVTNKSAGGTSFDDSETMVVVKGDEINDTVLSSEGISKIFGYPIKDVRFDEIQKPYEGKKWVVIGDSLTEINARSTKFYHEYVADDLGITVHNMGQSGTGYKRQNPFYERVSNIPTDTSAVTMFGSLNDLGADVPLGTKDDTGTDTLGGAINTTIDNLYNVLPTVPLGIISPTPWQTSKPWDNSNTATQYAKLLKDICHDRGIPFLDLYHSSGLRPWESTYRPLMYSRDDGNGTHPDENGHKLFYPQIREFVKTLI